MNLLNNWQSWVIIYLVSAVTFAQSFKKANRNMKNAGSLTVLLEAFTGIFSLFLIPLFPLTFTIDPTILPTLIIVILLYAVTDRLNIETRYGLEPSTFSMLKQLSTVFIIFFGFLFLKEPLIIHKIIGACLIIFANLILTYKKGKFTINKYFIMAVISNFLFAIAMMINIDITKDFNIALYTYLTVTIPALLIFIAGKHTIKEIKQEFNRYNKKYFIIAAITWALMLNASIRAYQLGSILMVASLFSLTSILNTTIEFIFNRNRQQFIQKIIASLLLIVGVFLVRI